MIDIPRPKKQPEKPFLILLIAAVVLALAATILLTNWKFILFLVPAAAVVGGMAAFLKLRNPWARGLRMVLAGLGMFWVCYLPGLLQSIYSR